MSIVAFDTLKFANQLQAGNFTPEQAQAMTAAMVEAMAGAELATKHDIAAVKAELKADIVASERRLEQRINGVKHDLEKKIDGVKLEISNSQISTQRFSRRFSSSRDFISEIVEASIPPYLDRHL